MAVPPRYLEAGPYAVDDEVQHPNVAQSTGEHYRELRIAAANSHVLAHVETHSSHSDAA
jgi:hypothetical protein